MSLLRTWISSDQFPKSYLHILVPQTINDGVQHRAYKSVENSKDFGLLHWTFRGRSNIHAEQGPIKHSHCYQMGPTGGKSFASAFSRAHPQDGNENEEVGDENYEGEEREKERTLHTVSLPIAGLSKGDWRGMARRRNSYLRPTFWASWAVHHTWPCI